MQIAKPIIKKCLKDIRNVNQASWTVTVNRRSRADSMSLKIHNRIDHTSLKKEYQGLRFYVNYSICIYTGNVSFLKVNVLESSLNNFKNRCKLSALIQAQIIRLDDE